MECKRTLTKGLGHKAATAKAAVGKAGGGESKRPAARRAGRPSALVDTPVVYCGDCLDELRWLPDGCVDLSYIEPPFNSNRNYEVVWGETKEMRAFGDGNSSSGTTIGTRRREYRATRPLCVRRRIA